MIEKIDEKLSFRIKKKQTEDEIRKLAELDQMSQGNKFINNNLVEK